MANRHYFIGVYNHHDRSRGAIVRLSTVTDFAARTEEAQSFADRAARFACGFHCETVADLLGIPTPGNLPTFADELAALSKALGERVVVESVQVVVAAP